MLRFGDHALAGGGAVIDGGASRLSRPALVVSILLHLGVLVAVGRFAWQRTDVELAAPTTEYVWIGALAPPTPPTELPTPDELPTPNEVPTRAPPPAVSPAPPPRPAAATPEAPPTAVAPPPVAPAEAPGAPAGPTRLDLDTARREAAAAVVEQHARDDEILRFSLDDVAPPPPKREPKKPSIFDKGVASGGSGVLSPGKARTAAGFKLRSWCNRISGGGFGFFGIPVCTSPGIRPPSGLFVESIPEYMKTKPECEETRPLAAALGETSEYPTVKCRLVPKGPDD
jgi:hypothetical protein